MPQLNPAPWLMIMLLSWLALLVLFTPKTTSVLPQGSPLTGLEISHKATPWNWPWA